MKKLLFSLVAIIAVYSFSSCSKELPVHTTKKIILTEVFEETAKNVETESAAGCPRTLSAVTGIEISANAPSTPFGIYTLTGNLYYTGPGGVAKIRYRNNIDGLLMTSDPIPLDPSPMGEVSFTIPVSASAFSIRMVDVVISSGIQGCPRSRFFSFPTEPNPVIISLPLP
jgi:hypothetical protein